MLAKKVGSSGSNDVWMGSYIVGEEEKPYVDIYDRERNTLTVIDLTEAEELARLILRAVWLMERGNPPDLIGG